MLRGLLMLMDKDPSAAVGFLEAEINTVLKMLEQARMAELPPEP